VYNVHSDVYDVHMSRQRLLSAAKEVLESSGAAGLTVRRVAEHAGLSPMAMYRHFANKDALLDALMEDGLNAWEHTAHSIRVQDPVKWLAALGDAFLEFALKEPHRFDAAFFLPAPRARRYPQDFAMGRSPVMQMAMQRMDAAKKQGALPQRPTLEMALTFSALAQGLVSMHRANRFTGEAQFRTLYRAQLRRFLRR
jgi:AcrR family transcriptional regulator